MSAIDSPDAVLSAFGATALCRGVDEAAVAQLFSLAQPVSFVAGSRLVRQGEGARGAYVLRAGEVEARVKLPGGGERTVAKLGPGSMFGEMALLDAGLCSASIFAVSNVDGWFIEREAFRALAAGRNAAALIIQRTITASLAERLAALNAELRRQPAPEDRAVQEPLPTADPLAGLARHRKGTFNHRAFLPILPFFAGFAPDDIDAVAAASRVLERERGQWLFVAGQPATACFLVVRGAIEVVTRSDGYERRMALLGPGTLVGYLSVLSGSAHGASARARETASLLEIPKAEFEALYNGTSSAAVKTQHAIHVNLLQSLARSNSQLSRLVTQAQLGEALQAQAAKASI